MNILNKRSNYWEYGFIILFPFYSTLHWAAPFVNLMAVAIFAFSYSKIWAKWRFFLMLVLMNIIYLAINYHLIYAMFLSDIVLHRDEYSPTLNEVPNFLKSIGETFYIFFIGNYHVGTFVTLPIFVLGCITAKNKIVKYLLFSAASIALLNGFYLYIVPLLEKIHPIIISFNIKRIKILLPLIWMAILAFSVKDLIKFPKGKSLSYFAIACLILSTLFANDEIINNYRNWTGFQRKPDINQFFANETMEAISNHIEKNKSNYRVAHLGINPTISQHNDFHTIDGLQAMYPLAHKNLMKEIMKGELEKDFDLVRYFDAWGNRCYLFSSELGKENNAFMISKNQDISIEQWSINTKLLKENGVEYIFSTVMIKNSNALDMQLRRVYLKTVMIIGEYSYIGSTNLNGKNIEQ